MKTLSNIIGYHKNLFSLALLLFSVNSFAQEASDKTETNSRLTTLQKVVDGIKEKNASIRNEQNLNVMVNDKLVENLQSFTIDPKSISMVEVVVLDSKPGSQRINPSIIINTKR